FLRHFSLGQTSLLIAAIGRLDVKPTPLPPAERPSDADSLSFIGVSLSARRTSNYQGITDSCQSRHAIVSAKLRALAESLKAGLEHRFDLRILSFRGPFFPSRESALYD